MNKKKPSIGTVGTVLVVIVGIMTGMAMAPSIAAQPSPPFVITGEVLKPDGSQCTGVWVHITNKNTGESWDAKNASTSGYYLLVLSEDNVSAGDTLRIETSGSGCPAQTTDYHVTQDEIDDGALRTYGYLKPVSVQPTTFITNTESTIRATLRNDGPSVGSFNVVLKIDGTPIGTKTVESLNTSEETNLSFVYTPTSPGTFSMGVTVDPEKVTDELNDNRTIHQLTVQVKVMGMAPGNWTTDSAIIAGLPEGIVKSAPTVFKKDETVYLISGAADGKFYGYKWTGSEWQRDDAIVSGLGDVGNQSSPAVFCMNGTWYLIAGRMHGFDGFRWVGSSSKWEPENAIVSGLAYPHMPESTNYLNKPTVFEKDGVWYLISGNMPEFTVDAWANQIRFFGHKWNGSAWEDDSGIVLGLPARCYYSAPGVFNEKGVWYLISGTGSGEFMGYRWTGSKWQQDDAIVSGLGDVGNRSTPTVFRIDGTRYLISGEASGGFHGFRYVPSVQQVQAESFDTGSGTYPSISGTHYGTIIPNRNIRVNRIYTYPCAGTGGHIEYAKIWNETTKECAVAQWNGYHVADYLNLTFNTTLTLERDVIYNYIIETGSYPQIIHAPYKQLNEGNITCTRFEDANGKKYNNWIPAFRLWYAPAAA